MNILKLELKRAIANRNMLITLILGIAITLPHTISNFFNELEYKSYVLENNLATGADLSSLFGRWFGMNIDIDGTMYFYIFSILAVYPAAMIYFSDSKSGYIKNLYTRCDKLKCLLSKYISAFVAGGIAVTLPLFIAFLLTALYAPARLPDPIVMNTIVDKNMWSTLYFEHPLIYTIGYIAIDFIFGGLFSCFAMSVSDYVRHKFSVFISSFLVVASLNFICTQLNLNMLNPQNFLSPAQLVTYANGYIIIIEALFFFTVSFVLFIFGGKNNETY